LSKVGNFLTSKLSLMTNSDKVKATINSLSVKYSKTSWTNILLPVFKTEGFDLGINQLISDHQAGQPFTPHLKDMFKSFDLCPLSEVKVVIVNPYPYPAKGEATGLALAGKQNPFTMELSTYSNNGDKSLEYLPQQGVLMLNASLTCPIDKMTDHAPMWNPVFTNIIKGLSKFTQDTVFVLMGKDVEFLSSAIGESHSKLFIPSIKEGEDWENIDLFDRINSILEKTDNRTPVKW